MAQLSSYQNSLDALATSMGVNSEVARTKAKIITDSYTSVLRYVGSDKKVSYVSSNNKVKELNSQAAEMLKKDSKNLFGIQVDDKILQGALDYVAEFEGNIASDKYVANDKANFPKLEDKVAHHQEVTRLDDYRHKPKNDDVSKPGDRQYAGRKPSLGILRSNAGYTLALPRTLRGRIISLVALGAIAAAPLVYNYRTTLYNMYQRYFGSGQPTQSQKVDPSKMPWVYDQKGQHPDLWKSLQFSDKKEIISSYKGSELSSLVIGVKKGGKWTFGLNLGTPKPENLQQVALYNTKDNKVHIRSSLNYETKPTKVAVKEAKVEPEVKPAVVEPKREEAPKVVTSTAQEQKVEDNLGPEPFKYDHLRGI